MRPLLLVALAALTLAGPAEPRLESIAGPVADRRDGPPLPALSGRVVDLADIFSDAEERRLGEISEALEARTSDQLVVVTVPSLGGETIEALGLRLGDGWGIGRADVDNGVLLIVAPNDRRTRVEVGCGLGGLLTDERAQAIIDGMLPHFRVGRYADGTEAGAKAVAATLSSDRRRPQRGSRSCA